MLVMYAALAALTAAIFWLNPRTDFFHPIGAAFYAIAGISTLCLGLLFGRDPVFRRFAIGLQTLCIPLQLATSTESDLPLLTTLVSITILIVLRPAFPRLSPPLRKFFLTVHVGFAASWLGAASAMFALSVVALTTNDLAMRHNAYVFMHLFDVFLWIPLIILALVSGLIVSLGTEWGGVRHWWILGKLVLALGLLGAHFLLIQLTPVLDHFWVRELAEATALEPGADLGAIPLQTMLTLSLFVAALWIATALSIYKPWGLMRWKRLRPLDSTQPTT
jgi:hypothetical protein